MLLWINKLICTKTETESKFTIIKGMVHCKVDSWDHYKVSLHMLIMRQVDFSVAHLSAVLGSLTRRTHAHLSVAMETDSSVRPSAPLGGCLWRLRGIAWWVAIQIERKCAVRVSTEQSEINHGGCGSVLWLSGWDTRRPLKVPGHLIQVNLLSIWLKTIHVGEKYKYIILYCNHKIGGLLFRWWCIGVELSACVHGCHFPRMNGN